MSRLSIGRHLLLRLPEHPKRQRLNIMDFM